MKNLFDYTLSSLTRHGLKNIVIIVIFGFLVFLLSSVIMITNSLALEYKTISKDFPDLLVQKRYGAKTYLISQKDVEPYWKMAGISSIEGRIWGQYYFERQQIYTSIFGIKSFVDYYQKEIKDIAEKLDNSSSGPLMITSQSILDFFEEDIETYDGSLPFFTPQNSMIRVGIGGVFKLKHSLENNDLILLDEDIAREILGIEKGYYADFVMRVSNPNEADFIADKIRLFDPTLKVITKKQMLQSYQVLYDYKSGWFLMLLIISFVSFSIILYDKASGLRSEEKKEIGILKALGWEISHIINYKLMESLILSMFAFTIGISLAMFFVYFLQAPGLKYVFSGYSELKQPFELIFSFDFKAIALIFFITIPLYVAVCIMPAWKIATMDSAEVLR
ncbi:ABC transporter, permease protein, FtsX/LolE family [Campylobacter blaseri]|uniref:ABC transporter permease n=1 Tax=Campylobacter blaseri TaxID=2042961 RepID=A0A2P8R0G1_9BACT|nr:FtsX-like permease family protein [Campylobacter blaseri]PSM51987.1 ABC transporter permease [Campylobacter blaseri]PSM53772.1 ABC transporter permease [Campylobacter blaseri]QKF85674.1 ABC transporter, permease protein, FtsX/LolE family [Campylobacter blaseri]